jgi:hypothetical protein
MLTYISDFSGAQCPFVTRSILSVSLLSLRSLPRRHTFDSHLGSAAACESSAALSDEGGDHRENVQEDFLNGRIDTPQGGKQQSGY